MSSLRDCYETLGLPPTAPLRRIARAYRELAKKYHPDVNPHPDARRRFVRIAAAYARIRNERRAQRTTEAQQYGPCPRCGTDSLLRTAHDGAPACSPCRTGEAWRRRLLPLPIIHIAKHLVVISCYAAAIVLLAALLRTGNVAFGIAALACVAAGFAWLVAETIAAVPAGRHSTPRPARLKPRRLRRRPRRAA